MSLEVLIIGHSDWLRTDADGPRLHKHLRLTVATNQAPYIGASRREAGFGGVSCWGVVPRLQMYNDLARNEGGLRGTLTARFSDRQGHSDPGLPWPWFGQPFANPAETIPVEIASSGIVRVNNQQLTDVEVQNALIYGWGPGIGTGAPPALWLLSIARYVHDD